MKASEKIRERIATISNDAMQASIEGALRAEVRLGVLQWALELVEAQEAGHANALECTPLPIATAPKGRDELGATVSVLLWMGGSWRIGHWDDDRYTSRPRPYWACDSGLRTTWIRANQPNWWMPLPPPPEES